MVLLKKVIPELNLWFGNILINNDINIIHIDFPVLLTQKWRCRDSVIDLLFNECCDPSGNEYDGFHFIQRYKTMNLNRVYPYDSTLYKRIQTILNRCYLFAADDPTNSELQATFNAATPSFIVNDSLDNLDTIAQAAGVTPTKYVTQYNSEIITTGTDQLHRELPDKDYGGNDPQEPSIYSPGEFIFDFTNEELEMLEYLYFYRSEQYHLIPEFGETFFEDLQSPLSKWVYLYLQCYLRNTVHWQYLNTICDMETDGILRTMYEKHAQDRIYQYIQKQYHIIWNRVDELGNNELRRIFEDFTMPCHTHLEKGRITGDNLVNKEIRLDSYDIENQPISSISFEFIYDGIILMAGKDYVIVNQGNLKDSKPVIQLLKPSKFSTGKKYQLLWSNLKLTTPYTREKGFKTNG